MDVAQRAISQWNLSLASEAHMTNSARQPWDLARFLKTLDFFGAIPLISPLKTLLGGTSPVTIQPQGQMLFDFARSEATVDLWGNLDDVVMGGVSASQLTQTETGLLFSGTVSTANSGGFASIRTRNFVPPLSVTEATGLELRVHGDGQRYKVLIRDAQSWDSVAFSHSFETVAGEWISVRCPFAQLRPVFRAKTVTSASPLALARIQSFQLMLSKFEYDGALNPQFHPGEFSLLIASIQTYRD
jgi:hypothetical protein